jgi:hypothetical protein
MNNWPNHYCQLDDLMPSMANGGGAFGNGSMTPPPRPTPTMARTAQGRACVARSPQLTRSYNDWVLTMRSGSGAMDSVKL